MANLGSTAVVRPAMQYIFATKHHFVAPVILRADILQGPASSHVRPALSRRLHLIRSAFSHHQEPVDALVLAEEAAKVGANLTLCLGWTEPGGRELAALPPSAARYSWRDVLDMLASAHDLRQPLLFRANALLVITTAPLFFSLESL